MVLDQSGNRTQSQDYYAYGLSMPTRSYFGNTKEGFTGKETDLETGLQYFGARYYMPNLGRWMAIDPLAEKHPDWTPYNYVLANPLNLYDPDGRQVYGGSGYRYTETGPGIERISPIDNPEIIRNQVSGADLALRIFNEPYDWFRVGTEWAQGNGSYWDAAGLLPFIPAGGRRAMNLMDNSLPLISQGLKNTVTRLDDKLTRITDNFAFGSGGGAFKNIYEEKVTQFFEGNVSAHNVRVYNKATGIEKTEIDIIFSNGTLGQLKSGSGGGSVSQLITTIQVADEIGSSKVLLIHSNLSNRTWEDIRNATIDGLSPQLREKVLDGKILLQQLYLPQPR